MKKKVEEGQEEKMGTLMAGPDLSLDPDIVAELDEDFDSDDHDKCLEDEFVINAVDGGGRRCRL